MASIDFTELFAYITAVATDGEWTSKDLSGFGVPDNAVVCILIENYRATAPNLCGVRAVGSSLGRYIILHEAESGGRTSCVMHVQTNSTASIEYYAEVSLQTGFTILGYYGSGITYTEEMTEHASVTAAGWRSTAVGQNDTVFEIMCQNDGGDGNTATNVGCRAVDSAYDYNYYDIHEAEPSGINCYTSYAQSDGSGNIELHRGDAYGNFFRLGYFSSNIQHKETWILTTPASDATWGEKYVGSVNANTVAFISCMHQSSGTEESTGARGGASSVERRWTEHESETDQYTGDTLPVLVDSSGNIDTYFGDVSDGYFYCFGYLYDTGGAPAAVAPTSVLYGPLCGPLAGPI